MPAWGAIHAPQENRFIIGPTKTSRPERLANNLLIPFTTAISAERPFPKQFVPCPTSVYQSHRGERKRSNRSRPHHHTPNFKVLRAKVQQFFFYASYHYARHALSSTPLRLCLFQTRRTLWRLGHWSRRALLCRQRDPAVRARNALLPYVSLSYFYDHTISDVSCV